jgi:hypothetical protein
LKISGDLRDIPDLAERLGKFQNLRFLDLSSTKIDELKISKLPRSLQAVNLTDSVVPLPLQDRLKKNFKDRFGEDRVLLTKPDKQIENYAETTLKKWVQEGASVPGSDRDGARGKTLEYLRSGPPHPSLLDVSGHDVVEFDEDWHAMVASDELKVLKISGNNLTELDLAKVALSPNLREVDVSNNLISNVRNAQSLARLDSLQSLDMQENRLTLLSEGIEYAPEGSTVQLEGNKLSLFSMIDARLIKFAQRKRLESDDYRREQRGPTILTDSVVDDDVSIASGAFDSSTLEKLDEKIPEILQVEHELKALGADAASRARWRDAGDLVEKEAYVNALEIVITNQGGPFKVGRMHKYHEFSQLATTIACNRASTLLPLEGQAPVPAGTQPRLGDLRRGAEIAGVAGRAIPVAGSAVSGAAKATVMAIDAASARYFNKFHSDFLKAIPIPEHEMLCRVLPLAMTLTMGEQLSSDASEAVQEGTPRRNEPSQKVFEFFKKLAAAVGKKTPTSDAIEQRAFRDTANLMDDIATGKAFGISNNAPALHEKLHGMTFDQKVETALTYWANGHKLPFKNRYILSDSPLVKQLATIAKNYTLNDLAQEKEIRSLKDKLDGEHRKRHEEKRKRRATTKQLKEDGGMDFLELSDWKSESEDDKAWWAEKFPPKSAPADLSSEEDISSSGKENEPAAGTARTSALPAASAKGANPDKAPLLRRTASADSSQYNSAEETLSKTHKGEKSGELAALRRTDADDSLYDSPAAGTEASHNQTFRVVAQARGGGGSTSQDSSSRNSSPHKRNEQAVRGGRGSG